MLKKSVASFLLALISVNQSVSADVVLHVKPGGSDQAAGHMHQPLASIEGAQFRIRSLREHGSLPPGKVEVVVQAGTYNLTKPVHFESQDSGTADQPITYRAEGQVILRSGIEIKHWSQYKPGQDKKTLTAKTNLWVADIGNERKDSPESIVEFTYPARNLHETALPGPVILCVQQMATRLATWPNQGWACASDSDAATGSIGLSDPFWHFAGDSIWLHGFFENEYMDECFPIEIEATKGRAKLMTNRSLKSNTRYRIENHIAAADEAGEYYLDPQEQRITLCLQEEPRDAFLVTGSCPVSFYGASHIDFRGFTVAGARNMGIEIAGGHNIRVEHCTIQDCGNSGVHVFYGQEHTIAGCQIDRTGADGIRIEAGDRVTLRQSKHIVADNRVTNFGQRYASYRPGVNVIGCGARVEKNYIANGPHSAIIVSGNDHEVLDNHVENVCLETDDVGAIMLSGDPTYFGNRIHRNFIHDCGDGTRTSVVGIYLDDFASGTSVVSNVIQRLPRGIVIAGGRHNSIEDNVITGCIAGIQADSRGTTWASNSFAAEGNILSVATKRLGDSMPQFVERFPELLAWTKDSQPGKPIGNRIVGNWTDCILDVDLQDDLAMATFVVQSNQAHALRYLDDVGGGRFVTKLNSPISPSVSQWSRPIGVSAAATEAPID